MKSALALVFLSAFASMFASALASHGIVHKHRCTSSEHSASELSTPNNCTDGTNGWGQHPSGTASFTQYSGCNTPSCGHKLAGFSAAVNQFAFGAGSSAGDACGRCFNITSNADPYSPSSPPEPNSIIVRVNDLCPIQGNAEWCGQTASQPLNQHGMSMHFDLCEDSQAASAFFNQGRYALTGTFFEVPCEDHNRNSGEVGNSLWNGSCLKDGNTLWPATECCNNGNPPQ